MGKKQNYLSKKHDVKFSFKTELMNQPNFGLFFKIAAT